MTYTEDPLVIRQRVDTGNAELFNEPGPPGRWSLFVNDVAQSFVNLLEPDQLEFDYTKWVAAVIDSIGDPASGLHVLHLGGGALTLPRYIAATRPGSEQTVGEIDRRLTELVLQHLPLPPEERIDFVFADAAEIIQSQPDCSFDLVIADAYKSARMPATMAGTMFAHEAKRVLRHGGTYIINVIDVPPYMASRSQAATLRNIFADVAVVAGHQGPPRPRFDNLILAASTAADGLSEHAIRAAARLHGTDTPLLRGRQVDVFVNA